MGLFIVRNDGFDISDIADLMGSDLNRMSRCFGCKLALFDPYRNKSEHVADGDFVTHAVANNNSGILIFAYVGKQFRCFFVYKRNASKIGFDSKSAKLRSSFRSVAAYEE